MTMRLARRSPPWRDLAWSAGVAAVSLLVFSAATDPSEAARRLRRVKPVAAGVFFLESSPSQVYVKKPVSFQRPRLTLRKFKKRRKSRDADALAAKVVEPPPQGPIKIVISLGEQRLSVYDGSGTEVASSPVSSGRQGFGTPMGVFSIVQKNRHHVSNLYNASMPYMQRITWSGVAMHEGVVPGYPASHGCIRLPGAFARKLWSMTKMGARVVVTRDGVAPADVEHARLFIRKPLPIELDPPIAARLRVMRAANPALTLTSINPVSSANAAAVSETASLKSTGSDAPITVFISRKDGKLYVRRKGATVYEADVAITRPELAIGTHVFTANALNVDGETMRWSAISVPSSYGKAKTGKKISRKKGKKLVTEVAIAAPLAAPLPTAFEAFDRVSIPQAVVARINDQMTVGSSIIISDNADSYETTKGTDFIVLTR